MKYLYAFDAWLLDKFQRFSDFVSRKTGIGNVNYKIADGCMTVYIVLNGAFFVIMKEYDLWNLFVIVNVFLMCAWFRYRLMPYLKNNESSQSNEERADRPIIIQVVLFYFRIFSLSIMIEAFVLINLSDKIFALKLLTVVIVVSFFLFFYFVSCNGLPRQKGKIRQWVRSLFARWELVPVRNK
ncbi:MAG: hypothetical protein V1928_00340 [Parcubacteria group bacterium]